jgi:DNA mismatch endonuclease, patch repair protein
VPRSSTRPEVARKRLHAMGLRYVMGGRGLPGSPDLVLPRWQTVVLVHGCFWHRHEDCRYTTTPSTRPEFWQAKFQANVVRDGLVHAKLLECGWRVATVWECALKKPDQVEQTTQQLARWLRSETAPELEIGGAKATARTDERQLMSGRRTG